MAATPLEILDRIHERIDTLESLEPLLPLILWLQDKPYTLTNYFPFRPVFRVKLPKQLLLKTGRQVGKTTSISALALIRAITIPFHRLLIATPLKDQASNISDTYVKSFINSSPLRDRIVNPKTCKQSTLRKEFANGSRIVFRYAMDSASRLRSYTNDCMILDEIQDFDISLLPIIRETLTASNWRNEIFSGTPLSFDNTIEYLWEESNQNQWVVKCQACNFYNIFALDQHLEQTIGPWRPDISEERPATLCAKCRRPISPRTGRWVPRKPSRTGYTFEGYHVPQVVMPMHYADPARWQELLDKQEGKGPTPRYAFVNEVLGESYEMSEALITQQELAAACTAGSNNTMTMIEKRRQYVATVLAIDWGGGGILGESLTTVSAAGMLPDGKIEICFGRRLENMEDHFAEAEQIIGFIQQVQPDFIVHDYTGPSGTLRETIMRNRGLDPASMIPIYMVGSSVNYTMLPVYNSERSRSYFKMDKTKALQIVLGAIKAGCIKFFDNGLHESNQKLVSDFLSLIEERKTTVGGRETYRIVKRKRSLDDFAMASTMACIFLWHAHDAWPPIASLQQS